MYQSVKKIVFTALAIPFLYVHVASASCVVESQGLTNEEKETLYRAGIDFKDQNSLAYYKVNQTVSHHQSDGWCGVTTLTTTKARVKLMKVSKGQYADLEDVVSEYSKSKMGLRERCDKIHLSQKDIQKLRGKAIKKLIKVCKR